MGLHEQTVGLLVFFPILCTVSVGLRLFVRTRLCKGAFGWDDIALVITWIGLIVWVGLAWKSMTVEYESDEFQTFLDAKNYVCYVMSGVVKISVALVLYRLATQLWVRIVLIADMVICATWAAVVTLIIGLGCTGRSPYWLGGSTCEASNYAQEASYVVFNVFHVLVTVFILWGVQVQGNMKWAIIMLFGVGLLAAVAAILKLQVYVEFYNPTDYTDFRVLWYHSMIWAVTEHGLSLFAASILAVRPFFTYVSNRYISLSGKLGSGSGDSRKSGSASFWTGSAGSAGSTEMGRIGVRNDVDVRSEYDLEHNLRDPVYRVDAYGDGESAKMLMQSGSQAELKPKAVEAVEAV